MVARRQLSAQGAHVRAPVTPPPWRRDPATRLDPFSVVRDNLSRGIDLPPEVGRSKIRRITLQMGDVREGFSRVR